MHSLAPTKADLPAQGLSGNSLSRGRSGRAAVRTGTIYTRGVRWKSPGEIDRTQSFSAVYVGAQPAIGDGEHWRRQFSPTLDSALRPQDSEGGPIMARLAGLKCSAAPGTKILQGQQNPSMMPPLKISINDSSPSLKCSRSWWLPMPSFSPTSSPTYSLFSQPRPGSISTEKTPGDAELTTKDS